MQSFHDPESISIKNWFHTKTTSAWTWHTNHGDSAMEIALWTRTFLNAIRYLKLDIRTRLSILEILPSLGQCENRIKPLVLYLNITSGGTQTWNTSRGTGWVSSDRPACDGVMVWCFPYYWPIMKGIHPSPVDPYHKGMLMCSSDFSPVSLDLKSNSQISGDLRHHDVRLTPVMIAVQAAVTVQFRR